MLRNLKIGFRLSIGFGLLITVFIVLAVFELDRMNLLSKQTTMMHDHPLAVSNAVQRINTNIIKIHRSMKDVALAQGIDSIEEASRLVDEHEKEIYKDFDIIDKRFLGEKEKYAEALEAFVVWKPIRDEVISLMLAGQNTEAANITKGKGAKHVVHIEKDMEALSKFAQGKANELYITAAKVRDESFTIIYIFFAVSIVLVIVFAIFFTRSITTPIKKTTQVADLIAGGDLLHRMDITSNDEIGLLAKSFNTMVDSLKQAQDELVRKEKFTTIGRISGSIAHDVRHPLATIKNSAYFLNMTLKDPNEKTKKHLNLINSQVVHANEIITSLMRMSDDRKPERSKIIINDFLEKFFSALPLPEHIELVTEFDNECPDIVVDPSQLKQVFINLESNAVRAMSNSGTVTVKTRRVTSSDFDGKSSSQDGDFVEITFSDTGVGMKKEIIDKVFEPFYSTRNKGIGLGLSIVKEVIVANNGKITAESEEGKGSAFNIVFPGVKNC